MMVAGNAEGDGLSLASAADSSPDGVCDGLGGDGHFAFGGRDGDRIRTSLTAQGCTGMGGDGGAFAVMAGTAG